EPAGAGGVIAVGGDGRPIHLPYHVAFDPEAVEARRDPVAPGPEDNPAVVFDIPPARFMQTVDVVDVEIGYDDVGGGAEVVNEDVNAAAHGGSGPVIGDLQVAHFDVLDVAEQHGIGRDPAGFDLGNGAGTV